MAEGTGNADKKAKSSTDCVSPTSLRDAKSDTAAVGRSFVDAVWEKFNDDMDMDGSIEIYVPKKGPAQITDSGHLILPNRLHMNDCGITEAGHPREMTYMCQGVTELDLTQNSISSWEEVFQVIRCMPQLVFLNLTHNPLTSSPIFTPVTVVTIALTAASVNDVTIPTNANLKSPVTSPTSVDTSKTSSGDSEAVTASDSGSVITAVNDSNANLPAPEMVTLTPVTTVEEIAVTAVEEASSFDGAERLPDLHQLVLNDTGIDWSSIVDVLTLFPNLEELHLSNNNYTSVDLPPDFTFPSLQRLFFNGNEVYTWSEIDKLGSAFPSLQQLFLADTNLCMIDDCDNMSGNFSSLEMLSLIKTQLQGWDEVDKLRLLPSLTDVKLQGIPFLEEIEEKRRWQLVIARLPNITRLNGSPLTAEERIDAERAFIRHYMDSENKPERYHELEQVYGKLDPLAIVSLKPQTVFNVVVSVGERREHMAISANQTVRELKKTLQNMAGMPASKFTLFYLDKEIQFGADRLRYPDKMLYTYHLADGDEFIIQPK